MTVLTIIVNLKSNMRALLVIALVNVVTTAFANPQAVGEQASEVLLVNDITWEKLNPARGDNSPQAGTLWGDRNGTGPTGFLVKFIDGFSSPSHIHNTSYRAVVISGLIHNDDPGAVPMWMPAGSFWTQPQGEAHITAANGPTNIALVEIDKGPYLVHPKNEAFDSGERPVNVDASNIVWVDPPGTKASANAPKIAYLWGKLQDDQSNGTFVKLPSGFTGKIHSYASTFRAVIIKGQTQYQVPGKTDVKLLKPGSYFSSKGESEHMVSSQTAESIIYIRTNGKYDVMSQQLDK